MFLSIILYLCYLQNLRQQLILGNHNSSLSVRLLLKPKHSSAIWNVNFISNHCYFLFSPPPVEGLDESWSPRGRSEGPATPCEVWIASLTTWSFVRLGLRGKLRFPEIIRTVSGVGMKILLWILWFLRWWQQFFREDWERGVKSQSSLWGSSGKGSSFRANSSTQVSGSGGFQLHGAPTTEYNQENHRQDLGVLSSSWLPCHLILQSMDCH